MALQYITVNQIGNTIYSKEIDTVTKERYLKRVKEYPFRFFIPETNEIDTIFKDINGAPLKEVLTHSVKEFRSRVNNIADYGYNTCGAKSAGYQYMYEAFDSEKANNDNINVAIFDIETARDSVRGYSSVFEAFNPVTTISLEMNNKLYYWATKDLSAKFVEKHNFEFFWFMTEEEMLQSFMNFIGGMEIDIISGWNIETYDIPYVVHRAENLDLNPKALSPFGRISRRDFIDKFGNDAVKYDILGIAVLDYLNLYKKFTYKTRENYKLDTIAHVELDEKKVDYSEHRHLQELYENDFEKFTIYNLKDSMLVRRIDDKLKLFDLVMGLAYQSGVNFQDTLGTVKLWTYTLYREMMKRNIVPPINPKRRQGKSIVGGYVKDTLAGMYDWMASFDLASLYPHNQMGLNISFDTILEDNQLPGELLQLRDQIAEDCGGDVETMIDRITHKKYDLSALKKYKVGMSPNLQFFRNDKAGIIPEILEEIYAERKKTKIRMLELKQEKEKLPSGDTSLDSEIARLNTIQLALKIKINSEYGALANKHFAYFDTRNAEATTSSGQVAVKFVSNKLNEYMNTILQSKNVDYVVANDTDSAYLHLGSLVKMIKGDNEIDNNQMTDILDKICKDKFQKVINEAYEELSDYLNVYRNMWVMKREVIASSAVFVQKKRYFMHVLDDEGVRLAKPKLKITGLEAIKSSTPEICRDAMKELFEIMLSEGETASQEFIAEFEKEFKEAPIIDVSFPRSVNELAKHDAKNDSIFLKGTGIGPKAALVFNYHILKKDKLFETIKAGDKINFVKLKLPNPFRAEVMGLPNMVPEELGLEKAHVDYEEQFYKTFLKPVEGIMNVIDWTPRKQNSITDFFG